MYTKKTLNLKLKYRRKAFKAFKKASYFSALIDQIEMNVEQIESSNDLTPFSKYSNLLGLVTDYGKNCTPSSKNAYFFVTRCLNTIPEHCSKPKIPQNDIRKCKQSYKKFLDCTSDRNADILLCFQKTGPKFPQICDTLSQIASKVDLTKKQCKSPEIIGSFSNCKQFIFNDAPSIIGDCIQFSSKGEEIKTFFVEGDEVVEQTKSFNSDARELFIHVPAHSDRGAVDIIIGESNMITSHQRYCTVGEPPENFDMAVYEDTRKRKLFRATSPSLALNSSSVASGYSFDVVDEYLTDEEKDALPKNFRYLCGNKPIKLTSKLIVDENSFNNLKIFDGLSLSQRGRWLSRKPRILNRRAEVLSVESVFKKNPHIKGCMCLYSVAISQTDDAIIGGFSD